MGVGTVVACFISRLVGRPDFLCISRESKFAFTQRNSPQLLVLLSLIEQKACSNDQREREGLTVSPEYFP
ncbi:hypothetical protein PM082_021292 [Marasmius tenuissimus]|nr:hypothetical protein PM082_021292 [Marasmius tenuissimus]